MFCKKCGKEIKEGVRFCPYCGAESGVSNEMKATESRGSKKEKNQKENLGSCCFNGYSSVMRRRSICHV